MMAARCDGRSVTVAALQAGMEIGGFVLRERLHNGSMATLWAVERDGDTAPMVMKLPRVRDGDDPAAIVGFEVEQMILPRLAGPHVPRFVAAAGFEAPQPFIVMERLDGPTLRARLDQAPLPADEVARLGARVADALHDVHRQHVSHLDLKPSQVLWRPDGEAILDYARTNHVDHVLLGARASSTLRRYLGSVSSQVVAAAPCSVTVVRVPGGQPAPENRP